MMLYQVCLFAAIALTSPTLVAVGQLLVAPISMVWDGIALHYMMPPSALLGTVGIIAALALVIYASKVDGAMLRGLRVLRGRPSDQKRLLRVARGERSDEMAPQEEGSAAGVT